MSATDRVPSLDRLRDPSRRTIVRAVVLVVVLALLTPSAVSALTYEPVDLERGTINQSANGTTVISVQGFKLSGQSSGKKPARLVGAGPNGTTDWNYNASSGINWFYDVDPLDDGTLLVVGANRSGTIVTKYDPDADETVWIEHFDIHDTHDVDLINGDQLLIANMRHYNESADRNDDRLFIYDRGDEEVVWEYHFRNRYNRSDGGDYTDDWTHVNDVDKIGEGRYLASPRNMDEVVVVNRSQKAVTMSLGSDGNHTILHEQHNPQYLTGADGTPTILVADSENDRIVEYARTNGTWERTWTLKGDFNWPRDADRLPNGNTLITDSLNHRAMEVTPTGKIVWEYFAPWGSYEAERVQLGDEPGGPTIRQLDATGCYELNTTGTPESRACEGSGAESVSNWVTRAFAGTPLSGQVDSLAVRWSHVTPWIRPVWMRPRDFGVAVGAALVLVGWVGGETIHPRGAIRGLVGRLGARVRGRLRDSDEVVDGDGPADGDG